MQYAVLIEEAGGRCTQLGSNMTRGEALVMMRKIAAYDMREMGLDASEIQERREGSLLAPGAIYSVVEDGMALRTLTVNPNTRISTTIAGKLTCLCPVNGRRDYATVEVSYVPTGSVVELESFAAWLSSYAMETISHEQITEAIADEINEVALPDNLTVRTTWDAVEGVECVVVAHR